MTLTLDASLQGRVRLAAMALCEVTVADESAVLAAEIDACCRTLRDSAARLNTTAAAAAEDARRLYHQLGIDPTKTRPSSEALLRRVLKGEALYRINTLVDAINLSSLRAQLPFGLYDLANVRPPVVLRRGLAGEAYEGIRKGPVHLEGRPVLADATGPFGNPTSDSARTMITTATRDALVIVFAPTGTTDARLREVLAWTSALASRVCGGHEAWRVIL